MTELKRYWLPPSAQVMSLSAKVTAFEAMAGIQHKNVLFKPIESDAVAASLNGYVGDLVGSGKFCQTVQNFLQDGSQLDPKQFSLLTHRGLGWGKDKPSDLFYFDGMVNLMLFYGDPLEKVGVTAGIQMFKNRRSFQDMDTTLLTGDDIIINQIQAPTKESRGAGGRIKQTFANFRWEHLLAGVFVDWARSASIDKIFLLPYKFNDWEFVRSNRNSTAHLRYDVTAKRLGFRRKEISHPYMLELNRGVGELFNTFVVNN